MVEVMRRRVPWRAALGAASMLMLVLSCISSSSAEDTDETNVDLCNGKGHATPERQIESCTALLKSADNPTVMAVIYNNRGNAYLATEQYDLAIKDYGEAIKSNPAYA